VCNFGDDRCVEESCVDGFERAVFEVMCLFGDCVGINDEIGETDTDCCD
jgi:hypothetical protein